MNLTLKEKLKKVLKGSRDTKKDMDAVELQNHLLRLVKENEKLRLAKEKKNAANKRWRDKKKAEKLKMEAELIALKNAVSQTPSPVVSAPLTPPPEITLKKISDEELSQIRLQAGIPFTLPALTRPTWTVSN